MAIRLEAKHLPAVKSKLLVAQNGVCPLCKRDMASFQSINKVVDHDHSTGHIRGVLCRVCNGEEGRVKARAIRCSSGDKYQDWIIALAAYYLMHRENPSQYLHPTHLSEPEKRAAKNKKARAMYKKKKASAG